MLHFSVIVVPNEEIINVEGDEQHRILHLINIYQVVSKSSC